MENTVGENELLNNFEDNLVSLFSETSKKDGKLPILELRIS